jgi:predicted component of type VI protein secretion system
MPSLVYIDESADRTIFELKQTGFTIGRDPNSDACIDDESISTMHASIVFENGTYILRDHSLNGSFVNGEKADGLSLKDNDMLRFGPYLFLVQIPTTVRPLAKPVAGVVAPLPQSHTVPAAQPSIKPVPIRRPRVVAGPQWVGNNPIPVGIPMAQTRIFRAQPDAYIREPEKINQREVILVACLALLFILTCYFAYKSLSPSPETHSSAQTKENASTGLSPEELMKHSSR